MYKELQVVKAKKSLSPRILEGCLGTIVYVYSDNSYEVEFVDSEGDTLGVIYAEEKDIIPLS